MAIQFIENQPIRFLSAKFDDQGCVNYDSTGYSMLVQPGDPVCVQVLQNLVSETENGCDDDLAVSELMVGSEFQFAVWSTSLGTGWTVDTVGETATLDCTVPSIRQDYFIWQGNAAIDNGAQYVVEIDIISNSTNYDIDVYVGGRRIGTIPSTVVGSHKLYGECGVHTPTGNGVVGVGLNIDYSSPTTGELVLNSISCKQIAFCNTYSTSSKEYVVGGAFDSDTDWTLGSNWTYDAGNDEMDVSGGGTSDSLEQVISTLEHREAYRLDFTVSNYSSGAITAQYGGEELDEGEQTGGIPISGNTTNGANFAANALGDDTFKITPSQSSTTLTVDDVTITTTRSGWDYDPVSGHCHTTGWSNPFEHTGGGGLTIGLYYRLTCQVHSMTDGQVTVECGGETLGTISQNGFYEFFFTASAVDQEKFTPTSAFDGCIAPGVSVKEVDDDIQFRLVYEDGTGATDWHTTSSSQDKPTSIGLYTTWCLTDLSSALSGGTTVDLPYSCYKLQVKDGDGNTYTSDTLITYKESHDCTKRIRAWADGESLGFHFGDDGNFFKLIQRFRTIYLNPTYPNDGDDYLFSSGTRKRVFAERQKNYELKFDRMDEYAHDTVSVMVVCDKFEVDAVEYIVPFKDYEPEWVERGRQNLAMSTIEITQRIEKTLFNRNC